jgi:hypothetical protein
MQMVGRSLLPDECGAAGAKIVNYLTLIAECTPSVCPLQSHLGVGIKFEPGNSVSLFLYLSAA